MLLKCLKMRLAIIFMMVAFICGSCTPEQNKKGESAEPTDKTLQGNAKELSPLRTQSNYFFDFETVEELSEFLQYSPSFQPLISAHRGGPTEGYPENCLETLQNTQEALATILEIDIQMTKDGKLVLMHDNTLERTTTGQGKLADFTKAQLQALFLKDNNGNITPYKIPSLESVLEWAKGKALLSLDIKREVPYEKVLAAIEEAEAEANVIIIAYSPGQTKKIHRLAPHLMISTNIRNEEEFERIKEISIPMDKLVAFTGTKQSSKALYDLLHENGIVCIFGTMGNIDRQAATRGGEVYRELTKKGVDIISTDRYLEAAKAIGVLN